MSLSSDTKEVRKLKALRNAQKRLEQRFEYIDWQHDELYPEVEAFKAGKPAMGGLIEPGALVTMRVVKKTDK